MNRSSTMGNPLVATQQIVTPNYHPSDTQSQYVQAGSDQIRLDSSNRRSYPHFRAQQLHEFMNWLQGTKREDSPREQRKSNPPLSAPIMPEIAGVEHRTYIRVDSPQTSDVNRHLNQPNFDSKNYIPPADTITNIEQLKADGRVIGDMQQMTPASNALSAESPNDASNRNSPGSIVEFQWPHVCNRLLGSSSILNLEMNVLRVARKRRHVLVASVNRGAGATTVALTLAKQLAVHGKSVLLVDADLADSVLASRLGQPPATSWLQAISQRRSTMETLVSDRQTTVSIMPLISQPTDTCWPRKLYDQLSAIIDSISWEYDVIIHDVGPLDQLLAELSPARYFGDLMVLVSGNATSKIDPLDMTMSRLVDLTKGNLLLVENFAAASAPPNSKVG